MDLLADDRQHGQATRTAFPYASQLVTQLEFLAFETISG